VAAVKTVRMVVKEGMLVLVENVASAVVELW